MDTLIFGGLLATLFALCRESSRTAVLGAWWAVLAAVVLLTAHHAAGGPSLGAGL
ncbi:hypothetical protein SUDANB120_02292 [Streptomyces sp. enrichment culture]|uniref:DUF5993 family protein n=1 Tax=Streptomyces TaxID=1883 RepID=UPI00167A76D1|nr:MULTISPECIES: DUF5993 family protein [Streptomyces]MBD3579607.1 hypothetical protein [Streptomyces sp. KD18]GGS89584.1 hypothetical protein GCM10010286_12810 [Streptomyces toxytricini]